MFLILFYYDGISGCYTSTYRIIHACPCIHKIVCATKQVQCIPHSTIQVVLYFLSQTFTVVRVAQRNPAQQLLQEHVFLVLLKTDLSPIQVILRTPHNMCMENTPDFVAVSLLQSWCGPCGILGPVTAMWYPYLPSSYFTFVCQVRLFVGIRNCSSKFFDDGPHVVWGKLQCSSQRSPSLPL
jgi:hypothetical protein